MAGRHLYPFAAFVFAAATLAVIAPLTRDPDPVVAHRVRAVSATTTSSSTTTSTSTTSTTAPTVPDAVIPPVVDGLAPVLTRIKTDQPVVFLGIDDGAAKAPDTLQLLQDNGIKASLFLANRFYRDNVSYFAEFQAAGYPIENHTMHHAVLPHLSYEEQVAEICGQADLEEQQFGVRPTLFRPPGGAYNENTRRAAAACGMRAVVNWIAKANAGGMQYQLGYGLRPGDIVLMHFRPEFHADMEAFLEAMQRAGLHTELLEDWL